MKNEVLLPVVINDHAFTANADGMWNLTAIHKGLGLPDSKRPGQWSNAVQRELYRCGNFNTVNGDNGGTMATEAATIAYAMWVSTDFYLMVTHAFVAMRNSAIREAKAKDALLAANMPKATALQRKAEGHGLTWTEACRVAGIQQPRLALEFLAKGPMFSYVCDDFGSRTGQIRPKQQGFTSGAFVKTSTDFGNREGWRVKPRGLDWLTQRTEVINVGVAEAKRLKAKANTAAKASKINQWDRAQNG